MRKDICTFKLGQLFRQLSISYSHNIFYSLFILFFIERERERERALTGVELETWNTFHLTIKNVPILIKFSFKNKVYNYFIFKGSLYRSER
jgi:hypothetical protein